MNAGIDDFLMAFNSICAGFFGLFRFDDILKAKIAKHFGKLQVLIEGFGKLESCSFFVIMASIRQYN